MNGSFFPEGIRIGSVPYLNARPLDAAFEGPVAFDHPAELARGLDDNSYDVALVPAFFALGHPEHAVVDGVGIVSRGPVWSVVLASRKPLPEVREVGLDPASMSSAHLLRVLEETIFPSPPEYREGLDEGLDALLLIGSQAMEFRARAGEGWRMLDLGEAWAGATGLPFVFALWSIREGVDDAPAIADALRESARLSWERLDEICEREPDPAFAREYLERHVAFGVGEPEHAGLEEYRRRLLAAGHLPAEIGPLRWV
jgi:predicted solute-binding protein